MKNFIITFLIFSSVLLINVARGQPVPIQEIDIGSCWLQDHSLTQNAPFFKIASFGMSTPITFQVYADALVPPGGKTISDIIKTALSSVTQIKGNVIYAILLHCSAQKAEAIVPVVIENTHYCLRGHFDQGDNNLRIEKVLSDPENILIDSCDGVEPGTLLFGLKATSSPGAAITVLTKKYGHFINTIEKNKGMLIIKLKKVEYYREGIVKKKLETDLALDQFREFVTFNYFNSIVGQSVLLWKHTI